MASFDGNKFSEKRQEGQFKKHLNDCKAFQNQIKVAVAGRSGVGKSSFINAIRRLTADDMEAAEVGVKECTTSVQEYVYPDNNNFRIYDLPGLGNPRFQQSTYLAGVHFEQYDIVIILTASRFMNEDLWLAQQAEKKGKHVYFVRSKIDIDIRNDRLAHPRTHDEAALLNMIRKELDASLQRFSRKDIFLIDNYDTDLFGFERLTSKLIHDSNERTKDVLAFSSTRLSNEVIDSGAFGNVSEATDSSFVSNETMANTDGNKYSRFVEKIKQLKSYYDEGGIKGLAEHFQANLNEWKDAHITMAVTGRSGVGKSSFINAIRDVNADDADDQKPARVGVTGCTTEKMVSFDGNKFSEERQEGQFKKHLNDSKDFQNHIKIAVSGRSGVGKSSFINLIRGLTADDTKAAEVGVKECTTNVQEYVYPDNNNFRLYDLPGLGNPHFQQSTYLAGVHFEQYDIVIILTASRFMNEDLWLAQQAEKEGKHVYFVRSKISIDIRNDRLAHPRTHDKAALLNMIRKELDASLQRFPRKNIFLIDNYDPLMFDFGRLTSKLIYDSIERKNDVLAFSSTRLSNEVIASGAFGNVSETVNSSFVSNETVANTDDNKYSGFVEKAKQLKSYYDKGGIKGLAEHFQTNLNEWKDVHIKMAVTGRSGAGKSSFINAIRGVDADGADDLKPARVGVTECTTEIQVYIYPGNSQFLLYDLPGVGTPKFKLETYLKDVDFENYDLFIIITDTRFMSEDLWLARQAKEKGKPFYFVRSKIENDIRNDERAHRRTHNEAALLKKVREDMESNLKDFDVKDIFLIDNYDTQSYDFALLTTKLIQDSIEMKQEALVFSLACLSREVIEEKKKRLERRIPIISTFAGMIASVENISLKNASDSSVVSGEIKFYCEQFRVDAASLKVGVEVCDLSEDDKELLDAKMYTHDKTLNENMKQSLFHLTNYIPVVGNIVLGIKCASFLQECLDKTAERAEEIHGVMTNSLAKKSMT